MNKRELIAAMSEKTGGNLAQTKEMLEAFQDVVSEALEKGDKVTLVGWGTFSVADRPERSGRNPVTGEALTIPAKRVVKFKPSKTLNEKM